MASGMNKPMSSGTNKPMSWGLCKSVLSMLLCLNVGFVSACEAFGCMVLKDAAGMWLAIWHWREAAAGWKGWTGSMLQHSGCVEKELWPFVKPLLSSGPLLFACVLKIHLTAARMQLAPP